VTGGTAGSLRDGSTEVDQPDYQSITYSASERIATIVLNRPDRRNALDYGLRRELVAALRRAEADDEVTVADRRGGLVVLQRL
jgi:enoyl-CoA hydratase/carnithine racemase